MPFDIQYLLWLQQLREMTGGVFDEFFNSLSKLAVDIIIYLPYVILWCVSLSWGYRLLSSYWTMEVTNSLIKMTVCAYRPWIRSDLIEPAGDSKVAATGYSFPSGHTAVSTTIYGSVFEHTKNSKKWLATLCIVVLALTAFSRNFLGVHTPQDVVVALIESTLILIFTKIVADKVSGDDKKLDRLTLLGLVFVICSFCYIYFKPYPLDYVEGVLLVDPKVMMKDSFSACGGFLGFLLATYLQRHYIHYSIKENSKSLPLMVAIGIGIMYSWGSLFAPATVILAFGRLWGNFIAKFVSAVFGIALWPYCIMKVAEKE